jgi:hypothetical protein
MARSGVRIQRSAGCLVLTLALVAAACGGDDVDGQASAAGMSVDASTSSSVAPTTSPSTSTTTTTTTTSAPTTTEDPIRAAMRVWMVDSKSYQRFGALAGSIVKLTESFSAHDDEQIQIDCRALADVGRDGQAMLPVPDPIVDQNLAVALENAIAAGELCERGARERNADLMVESSKAMAEMGTAMTAAQAQLDTY